MAIDTQTIPGVHSPNIEGIMSSPRYQAIVRDMARMYRASGGANIGGHGGMQPSWKGQVLDAITKEQGQGILSDLVFAARKQAQADAIARSGERFDASLGLQRSRLGLEQDMIDTSRKDNRLATAIAGAGALASGYGGYRKMKSDEALAEQLRNMAGLYRTQV